MDGHTGLDMAVPMGSSVRAVKAGRVLFVRYKQTGYGYHVAIDHGGWYLSRNQLLKLTGIDLKMERERELFFALLEQAPEVSGCFYDADFGGMGIEFLQEQGHGMRL
ncbi:MAG: M23 family metallopeptidase [Anaerotruncus sp.]|nr:M23 family metallopeptidase [Anaerotruncus sp.]